jgi:hypothetical protein
LILNTSGQLGPINVKKLKKKVGSRVNLSSSLTREKKILLLIINSLITSHEINMWYYTVILILTIIYTRVSQTIVAFSKFNEGVKVKRFLSVFLRVTRSTFPPLILTYTRALLTWWSLISNCLEVKIKKKLILQYKLRLKRGGHSTEYFYGNRIYNLVQGFSNFGSYTIGGILKYLLWYKFNRKKNKGIFKNKCKIVRLLKFGIEYN